MNNEDLSIRHTERQNQVIDILLKENAYLKGFINRYILLNMGINEAEKELLQVMIGNNEMENSGYQPEPGNIEMDISTHQPIVGNNEMSISNGHATPGNKEIKISNDYLIPGIDELKLAEVINRVTLLMRSASKKAILNTAKLLF